MRTKTLVLSALLGIAASPLFAQTNVYSVNAVGYVQVALQAGQYQLLANPLNTTNNTLPSLFPTMPNGTLVFKWNGSTYAPSTFRFGAWSDPTLTLNPGEGCFIKLGGTTPFTNTFVGEVMQGSNVTNATLNVGYTIAASAIPQAGGVQTALGLTPSNGDILFKFDVPTQQYVPNTFRFGSWSGGEPQLAVAESFFYSTGTAKTWTRAFSVNN